MSKDAYWFKHDSNARNDRKLVKVRRKLGLEGIGIYWCIVEMLREESEYSMSISEIEDISFELGVSEELVNSLINDFDLFENDDHEFWSNSLNRRMEKHDELKEKRREAGRKGGKAKAANKQNPSKAKAKLKQSSTIREEEIRVDNIREEGEEKAPPEPKPWEKPDTPIAFLQFHDVQWNRLKEEFRGFPKLKPSLEKWECWYIENQKPMNSQSVAFASARRWLMKDKEDWEKEKRKESGNNTPNNNGDLYGSFKR